MKGIHVAAFGLALAVLSAESLGAQTCDSLAIKLRTDAQRSGLVKLQAILQPGVIPPELLATNADAIDSIARARCTLTPPPVPNQLPIARFTATCTGLTVTSASCALSGITSSDPDGVIASYAWTVPGCTASPAAAVVCTLPAPDTVSVTLTVTDSGGATGMQSADVVTLALPPPPPAPGAFIAYGVAEVPRVRLSAKLPAGTYTPILVTTCTGLGGVQAAIDNAQPGHDIQLSPGLDCGPIVLQAKPLGALPVVIRTAGVTHVLGERIRPTTAAQRNLAKVRTNVNGATRAVVAAPNAKGYHLTGFEVTVGPAVTQSTTLAMLGTQNASADDSTVSDIALVGMYIHGNATAAVTRCVALNGQRMVVEDSWIDDCHIKGGDSQAIMGWNGAGPYRIYNNYLAGAAENVMFGGADPSRRNNVPADIEIGRNHLHTPATWKGLWTKKNVLEFKTATRVIVYENVLEGSWIDGQIGWAISIKSANQNGGCRACSTSDVTIVDNLVRNTTGWVNLLGNANQSVRPTDSTTRRITITRLLLEDSVGIGPYGGAAPRILQLQGPTHDIEITDSRAVDYGINPEGAMTLSGVVTRLTMRNVALKRGAFGVKLGGTPEGIASWSAFAPGGIWQNVAIVGANAAIYPLGTVTTASATHGLDPVALKAKLAGVVVPR